MLTSPFSEDPSKQLPQEKGMLQERAEIQNMVVVRHWALVDLQKLYEHAKKEDGDDVKSPIESPPPSYDGVEHPGGDPRLAIEPAPLDSVDSKALVKYQEKPLVELDSSLYQAMARPDRILRNPDSNVVDYLLEEWTRLREIERQKRVERKEQRKKDKYGARYETDDSAYSSEDDFERVDGKGRYITNGTKPKNVKNVRFRARVDSDTDESEQGKSHNRPPSRHILRSDSSSSCSTSPSPPPSRPLRHGENGTSKYGQAPPALPERTPHPYAQPRDGDSERPRSSNGPPGPGQYPRGPMPYQQWHNAPQSPGLRTPLSGQFPAPNGYLHGPPPGPQRMPSAGPYGMPPPGYGQSPQAPNGFYGPPRGPPGPPGPPPPGRHHRHHHHERRRDGGSSKPADSKKERGKTTSKDVKRGLLGAAGVAGLLDLLGGLDGI